MTNTGVHFVHATFSSTDLYFIRLRGREELGRPFRFLVEFCCEASQSLAAADFLGQSMAVEVKVENGSRYFHGVVAQFRYSGRVAQHQVYEVELRPQCWQLTLRSDCRIFQNQTITDILNAVCEDSAPTSMLTATYSPIEYCTQYRESDFDFISRLMESDGIYYWFEHAETSHAMKLVDSRATLFGGDFDPELKFRSGVQNVLPGEESISGWRHAYRMRTESVELDDYDFQKPGTDLVTRAQGSGNLELAVYDYPGKYLEVSDGESLTQIRLDEIRTDHQEVTGFSRYPFLTAGSKFTLVEHPNEVENGDYRVVAVELEIISSELDALGSEENVFKTEFRAIHADQEFRPRRTTPKPWVRGPQTAVVVGPSGDEIWTDEYGRVKVQFHWDRLGENNENSSCWIRVSQTLAGKNWGSMHLPRIGQEVIVEYLEGDPDRPIITGRVYNEDFPVPYALPAEQAKSGIKTRSTTQGDTETFNELRFDDTKDAEEIYLHAERDFNRVVENNDTLTVGIEKEDAGDQTITIQNNRTVTINVGNDALTVSEGDLTTNVAQGDLTTDVDQGGHTTTVAQGDLAIDATAGSIAITAGTEIKLEVGSSSIVISSDSITISAATVTVEGTMKAEVTAVTTEVKGSGTTTIQGGLVKIN